ASSQRHGIEDENKDPPSSDFGAASEEDSYSGDGGAELEFLALGVLAEGQGPEAIAVAGVGGADGTGVAAEANFLFDAAQVGAEFVVADETKEFILHVGAQAEGEFLFCLRGEGDGFDFPTEAVFGAFGEVHADAGGVDAGALELGEFEERIEFT